MREVQLGHVNILAALLVAGVASDVGDILSPGLDLVDVAQKGAREGAQASLDAATKATKETIQEGMEAATDLSQSAAKKAPKRVEVSKSKYPESYEHAQSTGNPNGPFTKDTVNSKKRRRDNLKGKEKVSGKDLDEWPPAQTVEGSDASVKPISPSDNRGSGATIGGQTRQLENGEQFIVKWAEQ